MEELQAKLAAALAENVELRRAMGQGNGPVGSAQYREKITELSAEVVDSNPYSRLMALQKMKIVKNYEAIRSKTILLVGVGGIGSVAAEMLARCGIGKLIMYDYDTVEIANMNRLFFQPHQAGMTKTDAARQTLTNINPDVEFESYNMNITTVDNFEQMVDRIKRGGLDGESPVDLVCSCVDNFEARMSINQACNELGQIWMESGVSEDAVSGHIQLLIPGENACFACAPPLIVASGIDEKTLTREGVCAASLPTTMGIVAGMLVQNCLKYLLEFGTVSHYVGYSALKDFFPTMRLYPNTECPNSACCARQTDFKVSGKATMMPWVLEEEAAPAAAVHDDNQWGISCDDDNGTADASGDAAADAEIAAALPEGVEMQYSRAAAPNTEGTNAETVETGGANVADLMAQLKGLQSS
jgi:ubiquitin-like modifier-activating enzyme 5